MAISGRMRHEHDGRGVATTAGTAASREQAAQTRHRRALVLSEVAAEGPPGLCRVLRRAAAGDGDAAAIPVTALVHATPGMTALDGHQLLRRAHIRESELAGEISPGQRVALVELVDRTDRLRRAVAARPDLERPHLERPDVERPESG
ncbi:hypothetical protein V2S66_32405 [Streptomyces sp. V4-01]|uniref:Uncharacterized protein n=1 Tax=Actinacidiphila polyblastidii TaxID=3110430 RepID=A0ABU7PLF3_9ACTN|nr:hypothetical protein [Streptomyces sp. V4-01]